MNNQPILPEEVLKRYTTKDLVELVEIIAKILVARQS